MCTLTLVAENDGYRLAMNRDERIARGAGTKPEMHEFSGTRVLYPTDGAGGTWIGVNEHRVGLALLNWNDPAPRPPQTGKTESRGRIIPALLGLSSLEETLAAVKALPLARTLPFRMVGVFPREQAVREWRWNSALNVLAHAWQPRHWFSSGLSDQQAEQLRGATCREAWGQPDAGSEAWLRTLHASHADGPVAFTMCVHREEVQTLSYTEIHCAPAKIEMKHFFGNPCVLREGHAAQFSRLAGVESALPEHSAGRRSR